MKSGQRFETHSAEETLALGRQLAPHLQGVVLLIGDLGAGKTTLILSAARILSARGLKCAAIMNDQAGDLVDSAHAARTNREFQGLPRRGVAGFAPTGRGLCRVETALVPEFGLGTTEAAVP